MREPLKQEIERFVATSDKKAIVDELLMLFQAVHTLSEGLNYQSDLLRDFGRTQKAIRATLLDLDASIDCEPMRASSRKAMRTMIHIILEQIGEQEAANELRIADAKRSPGRRKKEDLEKSLRIIQLLDVVGLTREEIGELMALQPSGVDYHLRKRKRLIASGHLPPRCAPASARHDL
jgi:hypothetical protein